MFRCYVCLHTTTLYYNVVCCTKLTHRAMLKISASTLLKDAIQAIFIGRRECLRASTAAPATLGSAVVCMKQIFPKMWRKKTPNIRKKNIRSIAIPGGFRSGFQWFPRYNWEQLV